MDGSRFDDLILALAGSRRSLASGTVALAASWLGASGTKAKKKKKRKKRKPKAKPNEYGCLEVGDPCKSSQSCCSGICEGKKCRAHDTGTCSQQGQGICTAGPAQLLTCNNEGACLCFGTTAGSIACAYDVVESCAECKRDADCEALGFPPGSVCAPFSAGPCAGICESGMACLLPCPNEVPESDPE